MFLAENFGTKLHIVHCRHQAAAKWCDDAKARGLAHHRRDRRRTICSASQGHGRVGPLLKMNPPVRCKDHGDALWQGLLDGRST